VNTDLIKKQVSEIFNEVISAVKLSDGDIVALGCSTSEILGGVIGKAGSSEVGLAVVEGALEVCRKYNLYLAVQACEHINRALVVEKQCAKTYNLELVNVIPTPTAGGSCASAAYTIFDNAVVVEHITAQAGVDIGDTHIGMHIKFVQVPFRPTIKKVGEANITALTSRPKLIGGVRAVYR